MLQCSILVEVSAQRDRRSNDRSDGPFGKVQVTGVAESENGAWVLGLLGLLRLLRLLGAGEGCVISARRRERSYKAATQRRHGDGDK